MRTFEALRRLLVNATEDLTVPTIGRVEATLAEVQALIRAHEQQIRLLNRIATREEQTRRAALDANGTLASLARDVREQIADELPRAA